MTEVQVNVGMAVAAILGQSRREAEAASRERGEVPPTGGPVLPERRAGETQHAYDIRCRPAWAEWNKSGTEIRRLIAAGTGEEAVTYRGDGYTVELKADGEGGHYARLVSFDRPDGWQGPPSSYITENHPDAYVEVHIPCVFMPLYRAAWSNGWGEIPGFSYVSRLDSSGRRMY